MPTSKRVPVMSKRKAMPCHRAIIAVGPSANPDLLPRRGKLSPPTAHRRVELKKERLSE